MKYVHQCWSHAQCLCSCVGVPSFCPTILAAPLQLLTPKSLLGARHVVHEVHTNVSVGRTCSVCAQVLVCLSPLAFLSPNDSPSIFSVLSKGMDGRSKVDVCSSPTALSAAPAVIAAGAMVSGAEGLTDERELSRTVFRAALILCVHRCLSRRATCLWLLHFHDGLLLC